MMIIIKMVIIMITVIIMINDDRDYNNSDK